MKKTVMAAGILIITGLLAYPAFARGPGWCGGYGYGPRGDFGGRPGSCWNYGGEGAARGGHQGRLADLDRKYFQEIEPLRSAVRVKASELDAVLDGPDPDLDRAGTIQSEINDLRAKIADKRLEYEVEARKLGADDRYAECPGQGCGRGYGKGYGKRYGQGRGNRGCW